MMKNRVVVYLDKEQEFMLDSLVIKSIKEEKRESRSQILIRSLKLLYENELYPIEDKE